MVRSFPVAALAKAASHRRHTRVGLWIWLLALDNSP